MDIGLPISAARKDQDRFLAYCQRTAALKPVDELLTFADIAPLPAQEDRGPDKARVAAQAFTHVLSLASTRSIRVHQAVAYGTIELDVFHPTLQQEGTGTATYDTTGMTTT